MKVIEIDEHLKLQQMGLEDAERMFERVEHNRAELREWMGWVDGSKSPADTKAFIQGTIDQAAAGKGYQMLILWDEEMVGVCGQHQVNLLNHCVSMGYWLCKDYQGRGIMTRACEVMVRMAFEEQGLHRLELRAGIENYKSRAVAERLGFTYEGVCREGEFLYDRYADLMVYSLLKHEWEQARS